MQEIIKRVSQKTGIVVAALVLTSLPIASSAQLKPAQTARPQVARTAAQLAAPDPSVESQRVRLWSAASPTLRTKLEPAVRRVLERLGAAPKAGEAPVDAIAVARQESLAVLGKRNTEDIEALTFLVLMQAAKSAQEDLEAIMARVKALNEAKKCQRDPKCIDAVKRQPELQSADVQAYVQTIKGKLDSLSELGEMESLRMQMAMDRLSKLMSTLSNLLKKISDTSQGIIQNLK